MNKKLQNIYALLNKHITVITVIISAAFALYQYNDIKEREYKKPFYEKQIEVVGEVFNVLSSIDKAQSPEEKTQAAADF